MRRREFITLIGGAAAWPLTASAQQSGKIWRIGFLAGGARPTSFAGTAYGAFLRGMRELGYAENRDYIVEWRFAEGRLELLPTLAEELVRSNVDVIVTGLTAAIPVAQRATSTIPIVMAVSVDPVGNGYVASLANPTGNITGLTSSFDEIIAKQLQLVRLLVPDLHRIGFPLNRNNPTHVAAFKSLQEAAQQKSLGVVSAEVRHARDIADAFSSLKQGRVDVLVIAGDAILFSNRDEVCELALKFGLPTVSSQREYVEAGALMSYGGKSGRFLSSINILRRQALERCKTKRASCAAADKIFYDAQPQNCRCTQVKYPDAVASPSRRSDRVGGVKRISPVGPWPNFEI